MTYKELIKQAEYHFLRREHAQAVVYATQAIESNPTELDGYYWRGLTYNRIDALQEYLQDADALLACTPSTALHYVYRGWAYNVKRNHEQMAIEECSAAIAQDASLEKAFFYRAWANDDLKKFDFAISDCNEAIRLAPNAANYNCRGVIYRHKGDLDKAIADYDRAIELDPEFVLARNNRVNALHAKDENVIKKLVDIRENQQYMNELRDNIENVIPFLGAGTSIPYGYYSWEKLLRVLLDTCRIIHDDKDDEFNSIEKDINNGMYVEAATKMDEILANIKSMVCTVIERIGRANPIEKVHMNSILSEYLHLFPSKTILTTNYDTVAEDILKNLQKKFVVREVPALESNERRDFEWEAIRNPIVIYYLHGVYNNPASITLSKPHYDDYYGIEGDIKSNLRRKLPSKIHQKYNNSTFLYIGCGMDVKQDRVLKVIKEFYRNLPDDAPFSYALLNVNSVAKTNIPFEKWETQHEEIQRKLNAALDEKELELGDMNVRVIWYSAPNGSGGQESAKRQLLQNILGVTRDTAAKEEKKKQYDYVRKVIKKKEEGKKLLAQFDNAPDITTPRKDAEKISLSKDELKQIEKRFRSKIIMEKDIPTRHMIDFPMYKTGAGDELYRIYLLSENGNYYLSDEGATYAELDKIFELREPDVIKNLVAILRQYGCRKQDGANAFVVDCTLEDIHIKLSHLIQAISFMLNMKIFYV